MIERKKGRTILMSFLRMVDEERNLKGRVCSHDHGERNGGSDAMHEQRYRGGRSLIRKWKRGIMESKKGKGKRNKNKKGVKQVEIKVK